jgi:HlyD family secretion protein
MIKNAARAFSPRRLVPLDPRSSCFGALIVCACTAIGCRRAPPLPEGYQGVVEYDDRVLAFEVAGRVESVPVHRGDFVQAGQVLARLDETLQALTVESREKDEAAAQADLALLEAGTRKEDVAAAADDVRAAAANEELARKSAERVRALFAQGALPQAELDRASADLEHAVAERRSLDQRLAAMRRGSRPEEIAQRRARVDQARSVLALERERLARYILRANEPAEVVDVEVKAGEMATVGTSAITLADTMHPYVDVFVPQGELGAIRAGRGATVRVDASSAPFAGTVEHVAPEMEFTPKFLFSPRERPNLVVRIRVRIDDPERRLHAGVPAFARIAP